MPRTQARRPSLQVSQMIRQVLQSYSVAGKWRVLLEHSGLTNCMQGFGWAIAKALAEAGAEISLGVWVRHPNFSSRMSCALPAALSQPQMMLFLSLK